MKLFLSLLHFLLSICLFKWLIYEDESLTSVCTRQVMFTSGIVIVQIIQAHICRSRNRDCNE